MSTRNICFFEKSEKDQFFQIKKAFYQELWTGFGERMYQQRPVSDYLG